VLTHRAQRCQPFQVLACALRVDIIGGW
jgi:hypothetical protein